MPQTLPVSFVHSLGLLPNDPTSDLYQLDSRDLPNSAKLHIGAAVFPIGETASPPALGAAATAGEM